MTYSPSLLPKLVLSSSSAPMVQIERSISITFESFARYQKQTHLILHRSQHQPHHQYLLVYPIPAATIPSAHHSPPPAPKPPVPPSDPAAEHPKSHARLPSQHQSRPPVQSISLSFQCPTCSSSSLFARLRLLLQRRGFELRPIVLSLVVSSWCLFDLWGPRAGWGVWRPLAYAARLHSSGLLVWLDSVGMLILV